MLEYLTYNLPLITVVLLLIVLLLIILGVWRGSAIALQIRHAFFRNVAAPHRNVIAFVLGLIAALLPLTSRIWTLRWATWIFAGAVLVIVFLLIAIKLGSREEIECPQKTIDRFAWGLVVIMIVGFGVGSLIYQARPWWVWLWNQYRRINEPPELILEALFLLGVILGVYVVRNWAKEQEAFKDSLTGIFSGTFIAAILGGALDGLTPLRSLAFYALGFTLSATVNLLYAARLTANYTNKRSVISRALLEFLYGRERVKEIDGYFLKNFEEDTKSAKTFLKNTLLNFRQLVQQEFADRIDVKILRFGSPSQMDSPECSQLRTLEQNANELRRDINDPVQEANKKANEDGLKQVVKQIHQLESQIKRTSCYELLAIECDEGKQEEEPSAAAIMDREYSVIYRRILSTRDEESGGALVNAEMFRVGVAIRRQDLLEYVVSPGPYLASFPYFGSVAGLSVIVRQTIVMNRDRSKKFRSKDYRDGICPKDIEQWRGLDEIDFLSYISIPIVSRLGTDSENPLGVVNIDTKLFVTFCKLEGEVIDEKRGLYRTRLTPNKLNEYAANLYDEEDEDVKYLEKLTKIIEPVVELYAKCNIGAT